MRNYQSITVQQCTTKATKYKLLIRNARKLFPIFYINYFFNDPTPEFVQTEIDVKRNISVRHFLNPNFCDDFNFDIIKNLLKKNTLKQLKIISNCQPN